MPSLQKLVTRCCVAMMAILSASSSFFVMAFQQATFFTRSQPIKYQHVVERMQKSNVEYLAKDVTESIDISSDIAKIDAVTNKNESPPAVIFPGGGLFFYWQAGVVAYLQEKGYTLSNAVLSGASAGALSATLAKTNVCPYDATKLALSMSAEAGIWDRPLGLQGVWGSIIYDWLDQLLPEDALEKMKDDELHILVTPVPSFGKSRVSKFESRRDLIHANMASVHLPWFLDGNLTSNFRGRPHIDGSFLAKPTDYLCETKFPVSSEQPRLILDHKRDPVMKDRSSEFIKLVSEQGIWDILEQGSKHAKVMDRNGEFDILRLD